MDIHSKQAQEFVHLLTSHQSALRAVILSLMPGQPGVSDVIQEVNLTLWEKMHQFEPGSNFRAWAFSIARYKVMEHRRKLKKDHALVFDDTLSHQLAETTSCSPDESERLHEALENCLNRLRPKEIELLKQRYAHSGSLKDYAETSNQSAGALRVTLYRLRIALRRCMVRRLQLDTLS